MRDDIPRLVLDANVMVSALLGRSFPFLFQLFAKGVQLTAPIHQLAETRKKLMDRSALGESWVNERMSDLLALVQPLHPVVFEKHEAKARLRLGERGQPDWPVLAASLEFDAAIWSHDKDFFGSGAPVWSTFMLKRQLEHAG